mmetsp:Transcript_31159/g.23160  ORF Transcript_31159/g.23160 Transcript_31159/m.23160 type:complete len:143 (+) Transcript_31159:223-651(+)
MEYLKVLGYYYDLSFNSFLYPNAKDTRRLFSFLFEFIFKHEEEQDPKEKAPTNKFDVLLKRRLAKWQAKPWIMPEFLKIKKPLFVASGDLIRVQPDIDAGRMAAAKSKKAKGVYQIMKTVNMSTDFENKYLLQTNMLGEQFN